MSNFTDFFPAAAAIPGGGGGLLNIKRYSSLNSNSSTFPNQQPDDTQTFTLQNAGGTYGNVTSMTVTMYTAVTINQMAGMEVSWDNGVTTTTIASHPAAATFDNITINYTSGIGSAATNHQIVIQTIGGITVNPATDLGLADGAKLGYFMVGAGERRPTGTTSGAGGYILQGTAIIASASTDLDMRIALGVSATSTFIHSTITGGLTLTTANGSNVTGWAAYKAGEGGMSAGPGINGYGAGGSSVNASYAGGARAGFDGYGGGGTQYNSAAGTAGADGSITLYY